MMAENATQTEDVKLRGTKREKQEMHSKPFLFSYSDSPVCFHCDMLH